MTHRASCRCGRLRLATDADPVRVSVCHCLDCQKRSGSAFAAQARFPAGEVTVEGTSKAFAATADSGAVTDFHFCPDCGSHLYYVHRDAPQTVAVLLGAFDDPKAFRPHYSMFENRMHDWLAIVGDGIEHD